MSRTTQLIIPAAAVLVVAVVGYNLLPTRPSSVGGEPTPSAVPTSAPTPMPTPTIPPLPDGAVPAGTYRIGDFTPVPYTYTVSAGWSGGDPGLHRGDPFTGSGVTLTSWIIDHVYGNGCKWAGTLVPVATRAQLVAALVGQIGDHHSTPVETTIGGLEATKITMSLDAGFDLKACNNDPIIRMWPDPGPDESGGWGLNPGETATVYAIEGHGQVGVLIAVRHVGSPAADAAALDQVLATVRFEVPPAPSPS